tara:strand:+ start:1144 stop:2040 length:897 start_codon:yes stop_codon:yes gene_type:complete
LLTIIIPTHNRHHYLERVVKYYSNFEFNIYIIDSSHDEFIMDNWPSHIDYKHLPGSVFHDKILFGCDDIDSDLIALCADDDFLFANALRKAVKQMERNVNISVSFGEFIFFDSENSSRFYSVNLPKPSSISLLKGGKTSRLKHFMDNYSQILWSLYRKDILINSFEAIKSSKFSNDNFIESIISCVAISKGELNFMAEQFGVREINPNEHWGTRHSVISSKDELDILSFKNEITKFENIEFAESALDTLLKNKSLINRVIDKLKHIFNSPSTSIGKNVEDKGDSVLIKKLLKEFDDRL